MKNTLAALLTIILFLVMGSALAQAATVPEPALTTALAALASPPGLDTGDTAWMLAAIALVVLMLIPGMALFYGGLARAKNVLSMLTQVFIVFSVVILLWCLYGYSLVFAGGNAFIGTLDKAFLQGVSPQSLVGSIPEYVFMLFQGSFAAVACALMVGAFAARMKFAAVLAFTVLWFTFSYVPLAHMGSHPIGQLLQMGTFDFSGGVAVHVNAAIAALIGAYMVGERLGYGKEAMLPHSLTLTMTGASLMWVGWLGFNAGSALGANAVAGIAFLNTLLTAAAAALAWMTCEAATKGRASLLGAVSGSVAGLVASTAGAPLIGPMGAMLLGLLAGIGGLWAVTRLKHMLGADDAYDVFALHGVPGIIGVLMTGVLAAPRFGGAGGVGYVISDQLVIQFNALLITSIWSGVVAFAAFKLIDMLIGLRVTEQEEREGLDIYSHGESAYRSL